MKYCVVIIQNESTTASYMFDKKSDAIARFHHEMEYANNANITTVCTVVNTDAVVIASEKHTAEPPAAAEGGEGE